MCILLLCYIVDSLSFYRSSNEIVCVATSIGLMCWDASPNPDCYVVVGHTYICLFDVAGKQATKKPQPSHNLYLAHVKSIYYGKRFVLACPMKQPDARYFAHPYAQACLAGKGKKARWKLQLCTHEVPTYFNVGELNNLNVTNDSDEDSEDDDDIGASPSSVVSNIHCRCEVDWDSLSIKDVHCFSRVVKELRL